MFWARLLKYAALAALIMPISVVAQTTLLNVSYDPTRQLYADFNASFVKYWQARTGEKISVKLSNGGSGSQARSVIDGIDADVVTLALAYDIDAIAQKAQLLPENWQSRLPHHSSPYTSTVVFLVRKGNPKGIRDWDDLIKPGVSIVTPNPKTSGGARWNYLAAWGYAQRASGSEAQAKQFVRKLYANVPVLDSGARGATTTFVERGIGDVLLAWENEAYLAVKELGADKVQIVMPSISILAEPPVAIVDKVVDKKGTRKAAQAYLDYLYTAEGQEIIARNFYRPTMESVARKYASQFQQVTLFELKDYFGNWQIAQKTHFADGGTFDSIYRPGH